MTENLSGKQRHALMVLAELGERHPGHWHRPIAIRTNTLDSLSRRGLARMRLRTHFSSYSSPWEWQITEQGALLAETLTKED